MFKVIVLLAIIAVVYGVPAPPSESSSKKVAVPEAQIKPAVDASLKTANGEIDPKNEKEELEGAEFGWGWKRWGWGYPVYRTYYYPTYYYSSYWW